MTDSLAVLQAKDRVRRAAEELNLAMQEAARLGVKAEVAAKPVQFKRNVVLPTIQVRFLYQEKFL